MRSVTHQLGVMVDELLTFSALEAGRETVHASEVSLARHHGSVVAVVEPLARQKDLELACRDARTSPDALHRRRKGSPDPREPDRQRGQVH